MNARTLPFSILALLPILIPFGGSLGQTTAMAQTVDHLDHLPPAPAWAGRSLELMLAPEDDWATDFERSGGVASPDYATTVDWARRLSEASDDVVMVSLGDSPQGRPIWALIASSEGAFTPDLLRESSRPVVFAHSGIHSGEIDGKDAGLMLLRDMTVRGVERELLDRVNVVFVPIFSVDAHERRGPHNRMNQRGPREQGWRTTARNLNLNRDYTKAQALEMQHMLRALEAYDPDLYLDLHVTDGADYEYDITYGFNGAHGWSPAIAAWLAGPYRSTVDRALEEMGHVPGPLIFTVDQRDIEQGMYSWTAGPRFSNGYGDARHLPTVLLENHSLKPYRQRVLGTYVYLAASLRAVADHVDELRRAVASDRRARPERVHLDYTNSQQPIGTIDFRAIRSELLDSPLLDETVVTWTGEPYEVEIPIFGNAERSSFVDRPVAYWIPAEWSDFASLLDLHGIAYERIDDPRRVEARRLRFPDAEIEAAAYEGRVRVRTGDAVPQDATLDFGPGALRVPTDQDRGTLATLLLEPQSPDGLFRWGFLLEVLSRTEYFETYVMEPMARQMLREEPSLAAGFEEAVEDAGSEASARDRLEFFYARTPYYDGAWKVYPIAMEFE